MIVDVDKHTRHGFVTHYADPFHSLRESSFPYKLIRFTPSTILHLHTCWSVYPLGDSSFAYRLIRLPPSATLHLHTGWSVYPLCNSSFAYRLIRSPPPWLCTCICIQVIERSNMTGGTPWGRPYIHIHLVNLVYEFEWNPLRTLGEIAIFVKMTLTTL